MNKIDLKVNNYLRRAIAVVENIASDSSINNSHIFHDDIKAYLEVAKMIQKEESLVPSEEKI